MMTAVFFFFHRRYLTIKINGHAQSAPEGQDLICAASSAFGFQAVQTVENMHYAGWLDTKPKIRIKKGDIHISLKTKCEYHTVVINMLNVVAVGYQILAEKYPEHVQLTPFVKPSKATK